MPPTTFSKIPRLASLTVALQRIRGEKAESKPPQIYMQGTWSKDRHGGVIVLVSCYSSAGCLKEGGLWAMLSLFVRRHNSTHSDLVRKQIVT